LLDALAGVANACEPLPGLVTAGQPTDAHFAALREAGCELVLDGRDPMEPRPFPDEAEVVRAAGMEYVNLPLPHVPVDDEPLRRVRELLAAQRGRPTLFHCNSGNRTGATMIPYLMLDRAVSEDDAVAAALRMGTRDPDLIQWALEYVKRQKAG
jgi:protein tyrosine phosphatase (PTP) superfamily phosphohydrolase (DUF442 family)